jgi:ribonuclease PH
VRDARNQVSRRSVAEHINGLSMHGVNTNTAWCLVTVKDFKANAERGAFSGWNSGRGRRFAVYSGLL